MLEQLKSKKQLLSQYCSSSCRANLAKALNGVLAYALSIVPLIWPKFRYITIGASLQRELSDAHLKGISIRMQVMKKREQDIEHGDQRSQTRLDVRT